MKVICFYEHGNPSVLKFEEVEDLKVGKGEVLVKIVSASVNRVDILVRKGYPGIKIPLPHIPGADMSGIVEEIGEDVNGLSIGDRVIATPVFGCGSCNYCLRGMENKCSRWRMLGFHLNGTYAEYIKVPPKILVPFPNNLRFDEAAALPLSLLTSWHALVTLGRVKYGDVVFVWAGSSGIGIYAIQIAKSFGAKVIATAGSAWKIKRLKNLGVDFVLNHYEDDVVKEVKSFSEDGVDLVIEHIGAGTFLRSIDIAKVGGKIIFFGAISGASQTLPIRKMYLKHLELIGMHTGSLWELRDALKLVESGKISPIIDSVFNLRDAVSAHVRLENSEHFGKIVLRI